MILYKYHNGNTIATIYKDGTRTIEWHNGENKSPAFPYNMDVKITNWCDNPYCVKYCYEGSNKGGRAADLSDLSIFDELPPGVEIALGGGDTFSHPDFESFVTKLSQRGLVINATINQYHISKHRDLVERMLNSGKIKGLGVSITDIDKLILPENSYIFDEKYHVVFHLVAGVISISKAQELIDKLKLNFPKLTIRILILGYKVFGYGVKYYSANKESTDENLFWWRANIYKLMKQCTLCFDNLALEQIKPQRFLTESDWETLYQGDDSDGNMYIDLVEMTYSKNSRSVDRFPLHKQTKLSLAMGRILST